MIVREKESGKNARAKCGKTITIDKTESLYDTDIAYFYDGISSKKKLQLKTKACLCYILLSIYECILHKQM